MLTKITLKRIDDEKVSLSMFEEKECIAITYLEKQDLLNILNGNVYQEVEANFIHGLINPKNKESL